MNEPYVFFEDLKKTGEAPENGILSRTLQNDEKSKTVVFGFAPGQELSAHTAPYPATLYFVEGEADITLGSDSKTAGPGTFVYMTARLEHGIRARTNVVMLLTMIK
ncbi:MAG: cupin domain-containing protein [Bryobacterales bacterium]|nr:cupin domain-containing protein [Bryobacterales bacterium]